MLLPAQTAGDSQDSALTLTIHFLLTILEHIRPPALPSRVLSERSTVRSALAPHGFLCPRCARLGSIQGSDTFLGHGGAQAALSGWRVRLCLRIPPAGAFLLPFKRPL